MDKNLHDIENLFRKALEDNEENPSQNAWDGIDKKLDKDNVVSIKKKYDLLKKIALLLLFLLTGLSIYVWKNQDKNSVTPNNDISVSNKETKAKNGALTEESGTTTLQKPVDSLTINKSDNPKQIAEDSHKVIDKAIFKSENINPKKPLNSLTLKNLSNTFIKKNKIKFKSADESLLIDVSKFSNQKKVKLIERKSNEVVQSKTTDQIEDKQPVVVNHAGIEFGNNLSATETLNPENVGVIKSDTADLLDSKESLQNIALTKINPVIQIGKTIDRKPSIKSTNQSRFAITAFYSPDITFHHFVNSGPGNSNNSNFDIPESESHASTLGALIDYTITKHWGLQSAITLARSEFELEYEKPETLYAQTDNSGAIQYKLATPLGDAFVKPFFSNNPNVGDSIFSKSTAYNLQYIGIPLAVKYSFNKGKFTLNVLGGVSANFLTRGQITTELEYGNDNETETTDKIYGLKPVCFSGLAGIGLDYNIYKKFSLSFSPTFRFALNSVNSNVSAQSYPNSLGVNLGLKMNL